MNVSQTQLNYAENGILGAIYKNDVMGNKDFCKITFVYNKSWSSVFHLHQGTRLLRSVLLEINETIRCTCIYLDVLIEHVQVKR